jgi:hypothetical protein
MFAVNLDRSFAPLTEFSLESRLDAGFGSHYQLAGTPHIITCTVH